MKGACMCKLCAIRRVSGGGVVTRSDRLRGFEIELSAAQIGKIGREACKEHLRYCETEKECVALRNLVDADIPCDCEACKAEEGAKKEPPKCPGHACLEGVAHDQWLERVVRRGARETMYPVKGNFTHHHHTKRDNDFWDIKRDGSCGFEIATPPMKGRNVTEVLAPLLREITNEERRHGLSFVDDACGLHATFDVQDLGPRGVKQLVFTALRHQAVLLATQPAYRKGNPNCRFIPGSKEARRAVVTGAPAAKVFSDRYTLVNLTKVQDEGLAEFRFGGATTDLGKIEAFGVAIECLIDSSVNRPAVCITNNRKRRFYVEVVEPYLKDRRVEEAWVRYLQPAIDSTELARI